MKDIDNQQSQLEAEATAYVVCSFFAIQSRTDFYLAMYRVTPAMLLEAVKTIPAMVKAWARSEMMVHDATLSENTG